MGGHQSKTVELDKVLGIGGEGVVIEKELEITVMQGKESVDRKKAENIRFNSNEKKIAFKFVEFKKEDGENFEGHGLIIQANFLIIVFDHYDINNVSAYAKIRKEERECFGKMSVSFVFHSAHQGCKSQA